MFSGMSSKNQLEQFLLTSAAFSCSSSSSSIATRSRRNCWRDDCVDNNRRVVAATEPTAFYACFVLIFSSYDSGSDTVRGRRVTTGVPGDCSTWTQLLLYYLNSQKRQWIGKCKPDVWELKEAYSRSKCWTRLVQKNSKIWRKIGKRLAISRVM